MINSSSCFVFSRFLRFLQSSASIHFANEPSNKLSTKLKSSAILEAETVFLFSSFVHVTLNDTCLNFLNFVLLVTTLCDNKYDLNERFLDLSLLLDPAANAS